MATFCRGRCNCTHSERMAPPPCAQARFRSGPRPHDWTDPPMFEVIYLTKARVALQGQSRRLPHVLDEGTPCRDSWYIPIAGP
jgi:hypothetical protein